MNDLTDEELMVMFQYGDMEAFDLLFEKYKEPLWRYLYSLCRDRHIAEDLLQEVFVKIARHAQDYKAQGAVSSWFYRIACNHFITYYQSTKSIRRASIVYMAKPQDKISHDEPSQPVELMEFKKMVIKQIDSLPENLRQCYVLYYNQGKKYQEIADILQLPIGTVRTHLHRARRLLAEQLQPYWRGIC